ncbi:MAG: ATP synthase F0 subunit C [Lachnospiraceae bacterium]|nr:ATP synthase F0 subunit C [Lachnospiraceae bacterium]
MKSIVKKISVMIMLMMTLAAFSVPVFAAESAAPVSGEEAIEMLENATSSTGDKALAAGICVGLAAAAGAVGMGLAIAKSNEGISRQPEAEGKIRTSLMLGLVFIETAIIYALIVAILIIFVL